MRERSTKKGFTPLDKKSNRGGFTLIEIMVSVSIFVIVAFIVTSVFLTVADASRKAQEIKVAMDNLSFALDNMTIKIREGINYDQVGSNDFSFLDRNGDPLTYRLNETEGESGRLEFIDSLGQSRFITSEEVNIHGLEFNIVSNPNEPERNRVTILVSGFAGNEITDASIFRVQTTIAQRNRGSAQ